MVFQPLHVYVHCMYTRKRVSTDIEFDWDEQNERHLGKHGISRVDTEDVLSGTHLLLEYQMESDEQRWLAVGATRRGRVLVIVFALRNEAVCPITGWAADSNTEEIYLKEWE
jgi:uncharacterized protein